MQHDLLNQKQEPGDDPPAAARDSRFQQYPNSIRNKFIHYVVCTLFNQKFHVVSKSFGYV